MAEIYVPGAIDIMGSANQMMQFRNSQQAQQANALQMQYTMEDRAREAENRKIAAGNALAARAEAQKIAKIYEQGFNPGQTALMTPGIAPGPGVVRKAAEPSYDYTKTALEFLRIGKTDKAKELFGLPEARREANAKGIEGDAKAQLAVLETSAKTYTTALERVKSVLDQATSIDGVLHYVDVVDADDVLGPLAFKTGGSTEARKEAIRKMAAPKEAGGGGMTVDEIVQRLKGVDGYTLAGLNIDAKKKEADLAQSQAATTKIVAETDAAEEKRTAPVYTEMDAGGEILVYDSNPLSKTHLKILSRTKKTLTPADAKPAAVVPTNLAKLITEEAALPEGSADKARYALAIAKELAMSDVAQTDLGKAVSERTKLKPGDPLIAQYDAYIAKLVEKGSGSGSTEKERAFAILAQGTVNPSIVNTPAYRAALAIVSQPEIKSVTGPNGEVKYVSVASSLPSWVVLPKENGAASQTFAGAVAQRQTTPNAFTNALTQAGRAAPQVNNLVAPAAAPTADTAPVDNRPDANVQAYTKEDKNGDVRVFNKYGNQIAFNPSAGKLSTEEEKRRVANQQLTLTITELEDALKPGGLIEQATGSGAGAIVDTVAGFGGVTTKGAAAIAALKPIYDMVLKTVPRFEGPQSDADIISYRDAAGRLADPTATLGEKQAAAKTILRLMKLRADQFEIAPTTAANATAPTVSNWK